MERLDQSYLANIVTKASSGSSNALAELYTACCQRHYSYIVFMLGEGDEARAALEKTYTQIFSSLPSLHKAALFMPWSMRIVFRCCMEQKNIEMDRQVETRSGTFSISQLLSMPLTESQMAIMRYLQKMSFKDIADLLNTDIPSVRRYLKSAAVHMRKGIRAEQTDGMDIIRIPQARFIPVKPDMEKAPGILESVFESCGVKPNTVPLEALSAYAIYRKERFSLQRGILVIAMIIFLLLPLFFIVPDYEVNAEPAGERGLPEYTIRLKSVIPAGKVIARINAHYLPVYEASAHKYTVEPTRNGRLTIEVELVNHQNIRTEYSVTDVDANGPTLKDSNTETDRVHLFVEDAGIGVKWRGIYAENADGDIIYPLYTDEEAGEVVFEYPKENWDVYIPDHIGNTLHLLFSIED